MFIFSKWYQFYYKASTSIFIIKSYIEILSIINS